MSASVSVSVFADSINIHKRIIFDLNNNVFAL